MKRLQEIYYRFPSNWALPFLLDGATGTSLMREGMPNGVCPEKWILEHPQAIQKIQKSYVQAGSNAVYAPTFGGNRSTLSKHGLGERVNEINQELVALSKQVQKECPCLIGGDLSPTGCFIEPFGDATFDEVVTIYREQAEALLESGVELFIIETSISLCEVRAAVTAIREICEKPIFVTLTVDKKGRTMSGDDLLASFITLAAMGISAFGTNCSVGPADMLTVLKPLVPYSIAFGIPLIAKPNAGMPHEQPDGSRIFDLSVEEFAAFLPQFLENFIFVIGGCCGTDERYIAAMQSACEKFSFDSSRMPQFPKIVLENLISTNHTFCTVDLDKVEKCAIIGVDEDLPDLAADTEDEFLYLQVDDENAAEIVLENAYLFPCPLVLRGNEKAISSIQRNYNGKILVVTE